MLFLNLVELGLYLFLLAHSCEQYFRGYFSRCLNCVEHCLQQVIILGNNFRLVRGVLGFLGLLVLLCIAEHEREQNLSLYLVLLRSGNTSPQVIQ